MTLGIAIATAWMICGQNPSWPPNDPASSPDALARRQNMPDDPDYAPRADGVIGCAGQLELYSFTPTCAPELGAIERGLGVGLRVDRAWLLTTGTASVTIAVLDSGANWDDVELVSRWRLNAGELPAPVIAGILRKHDANGDGALTVLDYTTATGTTPPSIDRVADERLLARTDRGDSNGNGLLDPQDLIAIFSDGADDDDDGYADDICGWDFVDRDNDPEEHERMGHGTRAARAIAAETNNGAGGAGVCPRCTLIPARVASFVVRGDQVAEAIVFAATAAARVIYSVRPDFGGGFLDAALRLAVSRGVLLSAGSAPGVGIEMGSPWSRGLITTSVGFDRSDRSRASTALARDPCAAPSLFADVTAPDVCDGRAPALAAGVAGLVLSASELTPALTPEELRGLLISTAENAPNRPNWTPSQGHGRIDARAAIEALLRREIGPEVELVSPDRGTVIDATGGEPIALEGRVTNVRHESVSWVLEYAVAGVPNSANFSAIASGSVARGETAAVRGEVPSVGLFRDPAGTPQGPLDFAVTIRLSASAAGGGASEARRILYVHRDLRVLPVFPVDLGAAVSGGVRALDLDDDRRDEALIATNDGSIDLIDVSGRRRAGWPVIGPRLPALDPFVEGSHSSAPAYSSGAIGFEPILSPIVAPPAFAEMTRGGLTERRVVAVTVAGQVLSIDLQGNLQGGFPILLEGTKSPHGPVIADLDGDGSAEIIVADAGGRVFVMERDGTMREGFPIDLIGPISAPAVGDLDRQGGLEIVIAGVEQAHAIDFLGRPIPGWPVRLDRAPPVASRRVPSPPVIASLRGARGLEVLLAALGRRPILIRARGEIEPAGLTAREAFGSGSNATRQGPPMLPFGGEIAAFDFDADGTVELISATGAETMLEHVPPEDARLVPLLAAWSLAGGTHTGGFPVLLSRLDPIGFSAVDLDGDRRPELIFGDGHERLRALNAGGISPRGWPKLTGAPIAGSPTVGDFLEGGFYDVMAVTTDGRLWAWRTDGPTGESPLWEGARHDLRATGNLVTPTTSRAVVVADGGCNCAAASVAAYDMSIIAFSMVLMGTRTLRRRSKRSTKGTTSCAREDVAR